MKRYSSGREGCHDATDTYRGIADHPTAEIFPGFILYRFDAALFFADELERSGILDGLAGAGT